MPVAIAMLAGVLILLCVVSLAYIYRQQRRSPAPVVVDDGSPGRLPDTQRPH